MARIVEHIDGRPTTTEVPGTPMQVHKQNIASGWGVVEARRMDGRYVMVEYRTATGMRTLYIWP